MEWFAVRHVVESSGMFEERITLWKADSADDAIARAEEEAATYAADFNGKPLDLYTGAEHQRTDG